MLFAWGFSSASTTDLCLQTAHQKNINSGHLCCTQTQSTLYHSQLTNTSLHHSYLGQWCLLSSQSELIHLSRTVKLCPTRALLQASHLRFIFSCLFLLVTILLFPVIYLNSTVIFICWTDLPFFSLCLLQQEEMSPEWRAVFKSGVEDKSLKQFWMHGNKAESRERAEHPPLCSHTMETTE